MSAAYLSKRQLEHLIKCMVWYDMNQEVRQEQDRTTHDQALEELKAALRSRDRQ